MNGAVELFTAARKHGIKPILGCEAYVVDDHERPRPGPARPLPPDAAGGHPDRLPQPGQAVLGGLPRGLPARQAVGRPRPARGPRRGRDRAHRLPAVALLPAPARRPAGAGAGPRRRADPGVRRRQRVLRGAEERRRRSGPGERGDRQDRARVGAAAGRYRATSTTCAARTTAITPRCCACRRSRRSTSRRSASTPTSSTCAPTRRWRRRSPSGPRRSRPRSRSPSAATSSSSSAAS